MRVQSLNNLTNDFQPQAADQGQKKIEVDESSFKSALGSKRLKVEKNLVAQALSNLLENAVKYADGDSKIVVRADITSEGFGISVISVGLSITEEDKKRIFQRGERGATAQKGTGKYKDLAGFAKSATTAEVAAHSHVLTPGRYVGAEEVEEDGEPFDEKMQKLVGELNAQFTESEKLEKAITKNLKGLGYGD